MDDRELQLKYCHLVYQEMSYFEDKEEKIVKKFALILDNFKNYFEAWSKLDLRNNGYLTYPQFEASTKRLKFGMSEEELNVVF